jgi:hypothetical protein
MFCAFRCEWFEKSGGVEQEDGFSYAFRKDDLELWIGIRSNPTFSDEVKYRAGKIELVRVTSELAENIFRHRVYNCNSGPNGEAPDLGLLSEYKASLGIN